MRRFLRVILFAVGALSNLCVHGEGSESKRTIQKTLSSGDLPIVLKGLKSLAGTPFRTTTTEHFTIIHDVRTDDIAGMGTILESAYERFYTAFSQAGFELSRSPYRLVWVCLPRQSEFNKYALRAEGMDLSRLDGYYSTLTNRVAVVQSSVRIPDPAPARPSSGEIRATSASKPQGDKVLPVSPPERRFDMTRLTHELAHQLAFNSGLQKRGVMYPMWVSEGLATNFESGGSAGASAIPANPARCRGLADAHAAEAMIPLRPFVVQTRVPADARESRYCYAQAWALFRFLLTEYPEGLRDYLARTAKLPAGRRDEETLLTEFVGAFETPESLEPAWQAFVIHQLQPATDEPPAARSISLRYDTGAAEPTRR